MPCGTLSAMDVLICEDDPMTRSVISDLVEDKGGRVLAAVESAADALTFLQRFSADVVIVDLVLRYGNGVELVERIRSEHPSVQVVVFTAHDAIAHLHESIEVVVKPDFDRLGRIITSSTARVVGERRRATRPVSPVRVTPDGHAFYRLIANAHPDDVLASVTVDGDGDEIAAALRSALRSHDVVLQRSDRVVALLVGGGPDTVRALQARLAESFPTLAARTTTALAGSDPVDAFTRLTAG